MKQPGSFFHYSAFGLSAYADRLLLRVRSDVYRHFLDALHPAGQDTILDVGASANDHESSNFLERHYPSPSSILALSVAPHSELREAFPGVTLLCGDGRALPLKTASVDFVYSHAVIEHVGSRRNQAAFIYEALRVCRKGVLITTPNRWHPVETHTGFPLLHFLPRPPWDRLCRLLGKGMYAGEETLNLLGCRDFTGLLRDLDRQCWQYELRRIRWLGLVSNWVLVIRRRNHL